MGAPVVHFEVNGKDLKALSKFYSQLFGWQVHEVMPTYGLVHTEAGARGSKAASAAAETRRHRASCSTSRWTTRRVPGAGREPGRQGRGARDGDPRPGDVRALR